MQHTILQIVYACLAVTGLIATWYFNLQFIDYYGDFELAQFISDNYVNAASASIANDIIVAALAFNVWCFFEARRLGMRFWWVYIALAMGIALAFAYPLFLFMRERKLSQQ